MALVLLVPQMPYASSSSGGGGDDSGGGGDVDLTQPARGDRITLAELRDLYHRNQVQADALCQALALVEQPDWPHPGDGPMLTRLLTEQHIQCPVPAHRP